MGNALDENGISIVIPFYNQEIYLKDCIHSLIIQKMVSWEAIVVDDGSPTKEAEKIIKQVNDQRIRYIRHPINRGLAAARNSGFHIATNKFILLLDSDDLINANFLPLIKRVITLNPSLDCVYGDFYLFGEENGVWTFSGKLGKDLTISQTIPGAGSFNKKGSMAANWRLLRRSQSSIRE